MVLYLLQVKTSQMAVNKCQMGDKTTSRKYPNTQSSTLQVCIYECVPTIMKTCVNIHPPNKPTETFSKYTYKQTYIDL